MTVPQIVLKNYQMIRQCNVPKKKLKPDTRIDICLLIFIMALFTRANMCKQPKCYIYLYIYTFIYINT